MRRLLFYPIALSLILLATRTQGQRITGNVSTPLGVALQDVTVTATRSFPFQQVSDTTDSAGNYALGTIISGLDGTYNVVANKAGYTFSPASSNVTVTGRGEIVNFTGSATKPTVTTADAINVSTNGATLRGLANPQGMATQAWYEYGTTTSYGSVSGSTSIGSGINNVQVNAIVANLTPNTTYHFRIVASNSVGVTFGSDANFITLALRPAVTTLSPTDGGATAMRLRSIVNPNGKSTATWFDLGTTTNYELPSFIQNAGNGATPTNISQLLADLTPGTTYHYRAGASSGAGTNYGADMLFTPVFNSVVTNIFAGGYNGNGWADFDNDGRLDVMVAGSASRLIRNIGGAFGAVGVFPYAADGATALGDYNNDGRIDILLSGWQFGNFANAINEVYRNDGNFNFSDINAGLPALARSALAWGDYDNDGRLDILLCGLNSMTNPITQVWRNTGTGFALDGNIALPGVAFGAVAWGDYDNDRRLDILLTGSTTSEGLYSTPDNAISQVWRNTGNGFVNVNAGLPGVYGRNNRSAVAWGDYDNDGRLDIVLAGLGNAGVGAIAQVWHNTGGGFELNTNAPLTGVTDCSLAWGDYDNDGRLDILFSGQRFDYNSVTEVWRNIGSGFVNIGAGLPGVYDGAASWGDYDNDGRLDIVMSGLGLAQGQTHLWRNFFPVTNSPPSAPSGLAMSVSNSLVTLSWNPSLDAQTPSAGLSYNVRISTSGGAFVLNPMSGANGFRRVAAMGNAQMGLTAAFKFETGTPYFWTVQAVDSGFRGSPFAAESSFKILPVTAPVAATTIIPGDTNGDGLVSSNELSTVLANYWANHPSLQMTNPAKLDDGMFQFALTNDAVWNFSVEVTTNLVNWDFLGPAYPVYLFFDPESTNQPQRSYRLRWP